MVDFEFRKITPAHRAQFIPESSCMAVEMGNVSTGTKALVDLAFAL